MTVLNLRGNELGDQGCALLLSALHRGGNSTLCWLSLSATGMGAGGAAALSAWLLLGQPAAGENGEEEEGRSGEGACGSAVGSSRSTAADGKEVCSSTIASSRSTAADGAGRGCYCPLRTVYLGHNQLGVSV